MKISKVEINSRKTEIMNGKNKNKTRHKDKEETSIRSTKIKKIEDKGKENKKGEENQKNKNIQRELIKEQDRNLKT